MATMTETENAIAEAIADCGFPLLTVHVEPIVNGKIVILIADRTGYCLDRFETERIHYIYHNDVKYLGFLIAKQLRKKFERYAVHAH